MIIFFQIIHSYRSLLVPLDIRILTREYFNRWYKLGPYFISLIAIEIPVQV